jgi:hypothetical protein
MRLFAILSVCYLIMRGACAMLIERDAHARWIASGGHVRGGRGRGWTHRVGRAGLRRDVRAVSWWLFGGWCVRW